MPLSGVFGKFPDGYNGKDVSFGEPQLARAAQLNEGLEPSDGARVSEIIEGSRHGRVSGLRIFRGAERAQCQVQCVCV